VTAGFLSAANERDPRVIATAVQACRRRHGLAASAWCALVLLVVWLSLSSAVHLSSAHHFNQILHAAAYAAVAGSPVILIGSSDAALILAMSAPLLGVLLEIGQTFVPGRTGDLRDAAADCAGALVGVIAGCWIRRRLSPGTERAGLRPAA